MSTLRARVHTQRGHLGDLMLQSPSYHGARAATSASCAEEATIATIIYGEHRATVNAADSRTPEAMHLLRFLEEVIRERRGMMESRSGSCGDVTGGSCICLTGNKNHENSVYLRAHMHWAALTAGIFTIVLCMIALLIHVCLYLYRSCFNLNEALTFIKESNSKQTNKYLS